MTLVPVKGAEIAVEAVRALSSPAYEQAPGWCEKFVREVVEHACPFRSFFKAFWRSSARLTMLAFRGSQYAIWDKVGQAGHFPDPALYLPGDIVYKGAATSGDFGHTGIIFHNLQGGASVVCVAENSSYHMTDGRPGKIQGAKGYRTLQEFGPIEMVVRLSITTVKQVNG